MKTPLPDTDHAQYFQKARSWDEDIHGALRSSKNRAWMIAFFCMGIALLCLSALLILLPLKSFEPYVLSVDKQTGYVEVTKGLYDAGTLGADEALTQSSLVRYVNARESYNPALLRENYDFIVLYSQDAALSEFQKLWSAQNPENPSIKHGARSSIDIKIKSVSLLNSKLASVRFLKELHENEQTRITHWNAIIEFQYVAKPLKMAERFINPLGFKVTGYRINPEGLEQIQ